MGVTPAMPESKDNELPREERLFARVPRATNEKIEYLTKRWNPGEPLSTADVIIRAVEQAYLKAKEPHTMIVPTEKKLLRRIKAGKETCGTLPVAPDEGIGVGDILAFREATFSIFDVPALVSEGESVLMRITKAHDTGSRYHGDRLVTFRWQPTEAERPTQRPSP
jgi:hypothetical protein